MFLVTNEQIETLTGIIQKVRKNKHSTQQDINYAEQRVNEITTALNLVMEKYKINASLRRVRYFIAQTLFETQNYTKFSENLNYSAVRLTQVWPNRFSMDPNNKSRYYAPNYANNPKLLANVTYGARMGNRGIDTDDGWDFRGSGAMHLTGRSNFERCSMALFGNTYLVENPDQVRENIEMVFLTAGWFWSTINGNQLADADAFTKLTGAINGSTVTAPTRLNTLRVVNRVITG